MSYLHRAVLLRAAAAALVLGVAMGGQSAVGKALAKQGAKRAEREAVCLASSARCGRASR